MTPWWWQTEICILSFLDDLYVTSSKERARGAFDEVTSTVEEKAGVKSNLGKLRAWSPAGGAAPEDLQCLGDDVWTADKPNEQNGLKILGTPLGRPEFVRAFATARVKKERALLEEIKKLPDVQCAWNMLNMSAVPRANHMIRMVPPSQAAEYADLHDDAIWACFADLCLAGQYREHRLTKDIASLPGRLGGLGLRSARRTSPTAYWASWATALPVIAAKYPGLAEQVTSSFSSPEPLPCLREAEEVRRRSRAEAADMG